MGDHHHFGRSSLLLASHDRAHREHIHQHNLLHRAGWGNVVGATVTEVVATVSVIQQVTVDSNGITIGLYTFTADSTGGTSFPPTTTENATPSITPASPGTSGSGSTASSTAGSGPGDQQANNAASSSQSLLSIQNLQSSSAATTPSSIPTTFASILANSTSLIPVSSATSLTPSFSNSSTSSSTLSGSSSDSVSVNLLSSSTISDESSTSSFASTSSVFSTNSASPTATPTDGIGGGGTGTGSGDTSTGTAAAGSGDGSDSTPSTSTVVGGVVGGVAGAAILIFLLMFLIRWKRRNSSMLALGSGEGDAATSRSVPPSQPPGGMAERSSYGAFAVPAALASLTGYKRSSQRTEDRNTISSTAGSERGFYRVSGRKLPSVLQSGGDGYGGGIMESNTLSGSSFYRDSQGFYGGPGGPVSPPLGLSMARDSGVPIMREGPARTPVTEQGPFANPPAPLTPPPRRPDVVGRSHPSFDGSQRSRFTEEV
ncbi:hypothetical protein BKA65DRAFT_482151 [Rhexocercosporidium sp. MPI-PUGE-AT-0058]|nr:hypothetical protein BKA65DRAFT_482151 [Rhexocercosporidium sp. MPI-PUGE-AT-0058]